MDLPYLARSSAYDVLRSKGGPAKKRIKHGLIFLRKRTVSGLAWNGISDIPIPVIYGDRIKTMRLGNEHIHLLSVMEKV